MTLSLSITYAAPPPADVPGGLILEQVPVTTGLVSRLDLVKALASRLYGDGAASVDCGIKNGEFGTTILVWPNDPAMAYNVGVTWGRLLPPVISEVLITEILQFSLSATSATQYPVQELVSLDAFGACWDAAGAETDPPDITWDGTSIILSKKIYGSLQIKYYAVRHSRVLKIPARDNLDRDFFSSVAWANWHGGGKLLRLTVPSVRYAADDDCAYRLTDNWVINMPDDQILPPTVDGVSRSIRIDYCTQKEEK